MLHESLKGDIHISHELSRREALLRERRSWSPVTDGCVPPVVETRYIEKKGA